jgi:hypothetical protein
MKLSRIPGHEPTVKHSFALKQSTTTMLQQYQDMYLAATGSEVTMKDMVEQMLLDFMADDKAFQKALRQKNEAAAAAAAPAPAAPAALAQSSESTGGDYADSEHFRPMGSDNS